MYARLEHEEIRMTTNTDIGEWFDDGVELGASHMIIVCDTFDHEDYPVYVKQIPLPTEPKVESASRSAGRLYQVSDVRAFVHDNYSGQNMQRTMEVYKLTESKEGQLEALTLVFRY